MSTNENNNGENQQGFRNNEININPIQQALRNNQDLNIYARDILRINQYGEQYERLRNLHNNYIAQENEFNEFIRGFPIAGPQFSIMGTLAILGILFDIFLNSRTLSWLPSLLGLDSKLVYVFTLIFIFLDGGVAIAASGLLVRNRGEYERQRKIWGIILWAFCITKIALFIAFIKYTTFGIFTNSIIFAAFIVIFTIIVYLLLHFGGAGLYYVLKKFKFWFLKNIIADYQSKLNQYNRARRKLIIRIRRLGNDPDEVFGNFPIRHIN